MFVMAAVFLALFGLVEALDVPILTEPEPWLSQGRLLAALVSLGLLVGDILLPVPATLVMIANGVVFGVLGGTALSLAGGLASASLGFTLGRRGSPWLGRHLSADERERAKTFLRRWGALAVIVSRPVPIISESVSILAGTTGMTWKRFLVASGVGTLPAALLYALTGATAQRLDSFALIFALVLGVAGLIWCIGAFLSPDEQAVAEVDSIEFS